MHLDRLSADTAGLPAKVLADIDAALETIRHLGAELGDSGQIELAKMARLYFEIRAREIEHAAMDRREDPFGERKPKGPVLVPMPTPGGDGGAA